MTKGKQHPRTRITTLKDANTEIERLRAEIDKQSGGQDLREPIAIIGMGCRFPGKATAHANYSNRFSQVLSTRLFVNFCAQTLYFSIRIFKCCDTSSRVLFSFSHRLLLSQFETL